MLLLAVGISGKYHPEIKWREIKGKKFHVVFPLGYEEEASYTLFTARKFYKKLQTLWGMDVKDKINILLTDSFDASNGSATFFPFNRVEIYLFNPMPDTKLGSCKEWIDLVLSHEMTHIFNMNAGSGFTYFMRKIFGTNPFFYPMIFAPAWVMEGVAVYIESRLTASGRLNSPDYKIMLNRIASTRGMPGVIHVFGEPTDWPGPAAKYFYGATFIHFLANRYGEDKVKKFVKYYSRKLIPVIKRNDSKLVPFTVSEALRKFFGKSIYSLWDEFVESIQVSQQPPIGKVNVLTSSGIDKKYPAAGENRRIYYVNQNYKEFPGIYELDLTDGKTRRLIKKQGVNGLFYDSNHQKLYFSAADRYKSYYYFSDIYEMDINTLQVKQLTRGGRFFHPVKKGNRLYCIKRKRSSSYLARLDLKSGMETILSPGFCAMAYPALSPEGDHIAVSIKKKNENWCIGIFSPEGKLLKQINPDSTKSYSPVWKNANELLFITEYKDNYRLACVNLETGIITVFHDAQLPGVQYFSLLPDKTQAIVSFFDANGFNLGRVNLPGLETEKISPKCREPAGPLASNGGPLLKIGKYKFLRDLFPKYFTPGYRSAGSDIQPGIFLSGTDIVYEHSFEFDSYYGLETRTFNWSFNYTYDGFYPTLIFKYSDFSDLHQTSDQVEYTLRRREMEFIGMYPMVYRSRYQAWWYSNLYFEKVTDNLDNGSENLSTNFNGITLGILYNSAKQYYDSISLSDGIQLALTYSRDLKFLGSDYEINTAALEYKHYFSIFRPNVLALRFTISDSWGEAKRVFYMGGSKPYPDYSIAGDDMFELMRGYPSGYFSGTGGYLVNMEYRIALFKIEKSFFISRGLERFYLNIFADIGNLWENEKEINPSFSYGVELNLAVLLGDFRYVLSSGIAVGQNPYHKPRIYFRIGNSF